jgi:hypothetical protein
MSDVRLSETRWVVLQTYDESRPVIPYGNRLWLVLQTRRERQISGSDMYFPDPEDRMTPWADVPIVAGG